LQFAYYRQSEVDKENAPYYLECFQGIARGRKSEVLETEAAMITSLGIPNRREIEAAYRALGIEPAHGAGLTDNFLIDQARSRFPDISPSQREELRRHLRVIGFARDSETIKREANDSIDTFEDAVRWLDLDPSVADDFVRTMFAVRVCLQQWFSLNAH
jgi:ubiquitin carboxyl-terminal hydrolase 25/28